MRPIFLISMLLAACGGPDLNDPTAASADDLSSAPTPFALQFSGAYLGSGSVSRLELHPDGSCEIERGSTVARGRWTAGRGKSLPLAVRCSGKPALGGSVTAYDGQLHVGGESLQLDRPARSDEDLCDASGGQWTDDDPDPKTGLYCICPAGQPFIPASGGCVHAP